MIFRDRMKESATLIPIGMMFLVFALLSPKINPLATISNAWNDGLRGLFFGLSIGINLWAARLVSRERRCNQK
jgi:hypothetical protein